MAVTTEQTEVPSGTGRMPVFVARPSGGRPAGAVLVVQEAFGLNGHIRRVAERVAGEGWVALAPDLYWRGGPSRTASYDELPAAITLMQSVSDRQLVDDVRAAADWLDAQPFVRAGRLGITGFCMGGRVSYLAACELGPRITACAPFYGGGMPVEKTAGLAAPVLAFFGEKDPWIPPERVQALRDAARAHGKAVDVVVYPGADHGFFCDERGSYDAAAAADAWRRLVAFFHRHLDG
jgi:dienelactone hydrolase